VQAARGTPSIWIWMVIVVLIDVFSRPDLSGWAKAACSSGLDAVTG
jgi:hypothetical protein